MLKISRDFEHCGCGYARLGNSEIADVFVGKTKESLDRVNYELVIADVISVFGPFVKFNTTEQTNEEVSM